MEKRSVKSDPATRSPDVKKPGAPGTPRSADTADNEVEPTVTPKGKTVAKGGGLAPKRMHPVPLKTRPDSEVRESEDDVADFLLGDQEADEPGHTEVADAEADAEREAAGGGHGAENADDHTQGPEGAGEAEAPDQLTMSDEADVRRAAAGARTEALTDSPPAGGEEATNVEDGPRGAPAGSARKIVTPQKNILGDYRLLKKLGQGGMGTVYKAHQISLDRDVALKVLPRDTATQKPALLQRFLREARVMAKLDHPNILRCYEINQAHGLHYFSMEYIDGGSVQDWLQKVGRFALGDALYIVLACARGLQHAHEHNMIHRDVKPENILITSKGVVKVADLGLAKALDEQLDLTRTGVGAGTPVYMAPEQAKDVKHVDHRSDIYSLGCMLYALLAGEAPFKGDSMTELAEAKNKGTFQAARSFNADIPSRLDLILDKMLAPKPELRYQSCAEVIAALEQLELANDRPGFLEGERAPGPRPVAPTRPAPTSATTRGPSKSVAGTAFFPEESPGDYWYVKLQAGNGEIITKKVTTEKILGLIKHGSVTATTQASRTHNAGFRNLATFSEFTARLQARAIHDKADQKGSAIRNLYAKIDKQEKWRQRKRWFYNLFLSFGGFVKLVIWLAILGVIGVVVYYVATQGINEIVKKLGLSS